MHVSVPGMYQNPAPYREQIFTYSTALAFTGRSAACAPPMARRPAAEPRIRLLTIFMLTSKCVLCAYKADCRLRKNVEDQRIFLTGGVADHRRRDGLRSPPSVVRNFMHVTFG